MIEPINIVDMKPVPYNQSGEPDYRRGYHQAACAVATALREGATLAQIDEWAFNALHQWRFSKKGYFPPAVKSTAEAAE